jgi:hypothetical protein
MKVKVKSSKNGRNSHSRVILSDYFKSFYQTESIKKDYENGISFFIISEKYNIDIFEIKRKAKVYDWNRPNLIYNIEQARETIFKLKSTRQQGFSSAVKVDDNLMRTLNIYTCLSDKLTKRCYDLIYPDALKLCKNCDSILNFSTFDTGYGSYKGKQICQKCINSKFTRFGSYSKISQKLFWEIYEKLEDEKKIECKFAELNGEKVINTKPYNNLYEGINKTQYRLDFICGKKNVEYDCGYFHDSEKDKIRDIFLKNEKNIIVFRINHADYIKDKEKEIEKCLNFLT